METVHRTALAMALAASCLVAMNATVRSAGAGTDVCAGDCNDDGSVTVDEILIGVNVALGLTAADSCGAFDTDSSGTVTVDEILLAVQAALEGCSASTGPRIVITSPRDGDFTLEQSIAVTGRVVNAPAQAMVTVNGAPTELRTDGTFSIAVPMNADLILNPVLAEMSDEADAVIDRDRIVVVVGDSAPAGQAVEQAAALRLTDAGFDKLETALPVLLDIDNNALVEPGTVVVNNYCLIDSPLGCIERIDVVVESSSFASLTANADSMPGFLAADIAVDDLVVELGVRGGFVDCEGQATVERVRMAGNYELEPPVSDEDSLDVNLIGEPLIEIIGPEFMFDGGACDNDLVRRITGDFGSEFGEALEEFLKDPDGDGPLDAPVAAAMQRGLSDVDFAAPLGEAFGISLETAYVAIDEDADGVNLRANVLATAPPPAMSMFSGSYRVLESPPTLTSTTPIGGAPYDLGLCVSNTELNQVIKAVVETGGLSLDLTELDLGSGKVPITAGTLSLIIPEAQSLDPNLPITLRFRPTVPPILTGAPGPNGELADLRMAGVLVEVISGLPGAAVTHLRAALDARAAFDLIFEENGSELRVALTPPQPDDITITVLDDQLGVDEARLQQNLAGIVAEFANLVSRELGAFTLPELFGMPARGIEISRAGDFPCMFFALPQP